MKSRRSRLLALILGLGMVATGALLPTPAAAVNYPRSETVALVPNAYGRYNNGGTFPTSGFPGGYAPQFSDVSVESIRDAATDPLSGQFDTVVLNGVCDISSFLANATFKARIEGFAKNGGKLIIWDSECTATDYSGFAIPFTTSNPGAAGASGTLVDVEENTLSSKNASSPLYVNAAAISTGTDAVGDANVFTTYDPRWYVDLRAKNTLGVDGPVQAYANLGSGLVIYCGLDKDYVSGTGFDPSSTSGQVHLNRVWLLELLQPWNPDGLPNSTPAIGRALRYVALGDSYSAGEGAGAGNYFQVNGKDNKCHRAPTAWSFLVAKGSTEISDSSVNVACTGALVQHVLTDTYKGELPQIQGLREANAKEQVDLVTITITGNDMGFGAVLKDCHLTDCAVDAKSGNWLRKEQTAAQRLSYQVIPAIRDAAPNARVVVVGYPRLLPESSSDTMNCGWLTDPERKALNAMAVTLDSTIKNSLLMNPSIEVNYISTLDSLSGHELCTADSHIVKIYTNPANTEQGHPNAEGQKDIARTVRQGLLELGVITK